MRAMSCGVLLLGGPVVALPALWRACSVLCLLVVVEAVAAYVLLHVLLSCPVCWGVGSIREGGGGEAQARIPAPGQPPPIAASRILFGGSQLLRWFMVLLVICGTVEDEW